MRNRLLIFRRLAHNAEGVLAAVLQLALVDIERGFNLLLGSGSELRVAALTDAEHGWGMANNPQLAPWHDHSLAQAGERAERL